MDYTQLKVGSVQQGWVCYLQEGDEGPQKVRCVILVNYS